MSNKIVTNVSALTDDNIDINDNNIVCIDIDKGFIGVHKSNPKFEIDVSGTINCSKIIINNTEIITADIIYFENLDKNLIPSITNTYNIGANNKNWANAYMRDLIATNISVSGNIVPIFDSCGNLGSATKYWSNAYIDDLSVTNINVSGNIIPLFDNYGNFGTATKHWASAYVNNINVTSIDISVNIGGAAFTNFTNKIDISFNNVYTKLSIDNSFNNVYTKLSIDNSFNNVYTRLNIYESFNNVYTIFNIDNSFNNVYVKSYVDLSFANVYTRLNIDESFNNVYVKSYVDNSFANVYTKLNIDLSFNNVYVKSYIDDSFNNVYTKSNIDLSFNNVYTRLNIDNSFNNVYVKSYVDNSFNNVYIKSYVDKSFNNVYIKSYVDNSFNNVYVKSYVDTSFNNVYVKSYVDNSFANVYTKLNIDLSFNNVYNKTYVDNSFNNVYVKSYIDNSFNNVYTRLNIDKSFNNVYVKTYVDNSFANVYTKSNIDLSFNNVYVKTYVDNSFTNVYTKSYIDLSFNNVYTKSYIDLSFNNVYVKTYVDNSFTNVYTRLNIDLSFNNVYTKSYIDLSFNNVYTKLYVDNSFNNVYTKSYVDKSFNNVYTKLNIDTSFNNVYVKSYVDNSFNNVYVKSYVDTSFTNIYARFGETDESLNTITTLLIPIITFTFTSINSNIIPSTDINYNLGSASNNWSNAYIRDLSVTNISASGNIVPFINLSGSLGTFGKQWANAYIRDLSITNISVSGNIVPFYNLSRSLGSYEKQWANAYIRDLSVTSIGLTNEICIGTNEKIAKLHIKYSSTNTIAYSGQTDAQPIGIFVQNITQTSNQFSSVLIQCPNVLNNTSSIGLDVNSVFGWSIYVKAGDTNKSLYFKNSSNAAHTTKNVKLCITDNGNVGIGTESPLGKLHIYETGIGTSDSTLSGTIILEHVTQGGTSSIVFKSSNASTNLDYCALTYTSRNSANSNNSILRLKVLDQVIICVNSIDTVTFSSASTKFSKSINMDNNSISYVNNITPIVGRSLGNADNKWTNAFIENLYVDTINGDVVLTFSNVTTNIIPSTTSLTLGSSSNIWSNAYIRDISTTNISVPGNNDISYQLGLTQSYLNNANYYTGFYGLINITWTGSNVTTFNINLEKITETSSTRITSFLKNITLQKDIASQYYLNIYDRIERIGSNDISYGLQIGSNFNGSKFHDYSIGYTITYTSGTYYSNRPTNQVISGLFPSDVSDTLHINKIIPVHDRPFYYYPDIDISIIISRVSFSGTLQIINNYNSDICYNINTNVTSSSFLIGTGQHSVVYNFSSNLIAIDNSFQIVLYNSINNALTDFLYNITSDTNNHDAIGVINDNIITVTPLYSQQHIEITIDEVFYKGGVRVFNQLIYNINFTITVDTITTQMQRVSSNSNSNISYSFVNSLRVGSSFNINLYENNNNNNALTDFSYNIPETLQHSLSSNIISVTPVSQYQNINIYITHILYTGTLGITNNLISDIIFTITVGNTEISSSTTITTTNTSNYTFNNNLVVIGSSFNINLYKNNNNNALTDFSYNIPETLQHSLSSNIISVTPVSQYQNINIYITHILYTGTLGITNNLNSDIIFIITVGNTIILSSTTITSTTTYDYSLNNNLVVVGSSFDIKLEDSNGISLTDFSYNITPTTITNSLANSVITLTPSSSTQAITITIIPPK